MCNHDWRRGIGNWHFVCVKCYAERNICSVQEQNAFMEANCIVPGIDHNSPPLSYVFTDEDAPPYFRRDSGRAAPAVDSRDLPQKASTPKCAHDWRRNWVNATMYCTKCFTHVNEDTFYAAQRTGKDIDEVLADISKKQQRPTMIGVDLGVDLGSVEHTGPTVDELADALFAVLNREEIRRRGELRLADLGDRHPTSEWNAKFDATAAKMKTLRRDLYGEALAMAHDVAARLGEKVRRA